MVHFRHAPQRVGDVAGAELCAPTHNQPLEEQELRRLHDGRVQVGRPPQVGQAVQRGGEADGVERSVILRSTAAAQRVGASMERACVW